MAGGLIRSVADMAERTPADRDRYVDFLRAFSIAVVVVGHYTIAVIHWEDGWISIRNAVGVTAGLWLLTWLLQVMPLFFIVGGFSNRVSWEACVKRGDGYGEFVTSRLTRLMRPTLIFLAVWALIQVLLHYFDIGAPFGLGGLVRLSMIPFGPLWFLLVYMVVTAMTPLTLALHRRLGLAVPLLLVLLSLIGDLSRFALGINWAGWMNLLWVWLFAHQLGYFYQAGSHDGAGRKRLWIALAVIGLGGLVVLTNLGLAKAEWGVYPRSMLGTDVEAVSNMSPPTMCIAALTVWLYGLAMLARAPVRRWLARERAWRSVIAANAVIMTAFLWHLSAYLVVILMLYPLGFGRPTSTTLSWWLQRPIWIVAPLVVLSGLIAVFFRFENARRTRPAARAAEVGAG